MAHYYDLVLGLIPLALGGVTAVLAAVGVSLTLAVPIAASVAVALIGHGMFVRAPGASAAPQSGSPAVNATPDTQINSAD
jgi:hypothetical protein